jgi:hypothetical protein
VVQVLLPELVLPLQVLVQVLLDCAKAGAAISAKKRTKNPSAKYFTLSLPCGCIFVCRYIRLLVGACQAALEIAHGKLTQRCIECGHPVRCDGLPFQNGDVWQEGLRLCNGDDRRKRSANQARRSPPRHIRPKIRKRQCLG